MRCLFPKKSGSNIEAFVKSLIADTYVNAYLQAKCPSSLIDIAYANALAFQKIKSPSRIYTDSTRVMTSLLRRLWIGYSKTHPDSEEDLLVDQIVTELTKLKGSFLEKIA